MHLFKTMKIFLSEIHSRGFSHMIKYCIFSPSHEQICKHRFYILSQSPHKLATKFPSYE